jgi:carboxypeptidase C (cathepsin A)
VFRPRSAARSPRKEDPSSTFITTSFAIAIGSYLANDLQYTNPSTYITLSNAIATWNFAHDGHALPDVIPDLAAAHCPESTAPFLALNGYHDLATPFFQTERDLARLGNAPNVQSTFYRGGHMTYLDDASRLWKRRTRPVLSACRAIALDDAGEPEP